MGAPDKMDEDEEYELIQTRAEIPRRPDGTYLGVNTAPRGLPAWMGRGGGFGSVILYWLFMILLSDRRGFVVAAYRHRHAVGWPQTVAFEHAADAKEANEIGVRMAEDCRAGRLDGAKRIGLLQRARILRAPSTLS